MSLLYRLLYRVGFTPWDTGQVPRELSALIEGPGALPTGRALDIGCGTGTQAVYMARSGWEVTAVDAVPRPLSQARARADAAGVNVDWILADAARLHKLGLTGGFTLIFDRGCFHGLDDSQRGAYAAGVDGLAAPGATLLMLAFAPSRIPTSPPGVEQSELIARFAGWRLVSAEAETNGDAAGPLRNVPRSWYRLVRG
ncbi:MAG TPA: class I SAM-dependent methyltransferase [Solirubrobacteraceae bacterium]|nr:class I SAM-dependent methyltransferase [Solirubrobacteraceae bacterium]